jgi:hypothetical protein
MMKKLVIHTSTHPKGNDFPLLYCLDESGEVNRAVTDTLLDAVSELSPPEIAIFESSMQQVEAGNFHPVAPDEPHWAGNATTAWFGEPRAGKNEVLIANSYVPEFSEEDGEPQRFTFAQLRLAMQAWRGFKRELAERGVEAMRGQRKEIPFPM